MTKTKKTQRRIGVFSMLIIDANQSRKTIRKKMDKFIKGFVEERYGRQKK